MSKLKDFMSKKLNTQTARRMAVLIAICIVAVVLLIFRLFFIQIFQHDYYSGKAYDHENYGSTTETTAEVIP